MKKGLIIVLLIRYIIMGLSGLSANPISDTLFVVKRDTIYQPIKSDQLNESYLSLLEKTNQQLGLWTNPYGIMIASLGLLFAILAIVVVVLFFFQSRDFKQIISNTTSKYEKLIGQFVEKKKRQLQSVEQNLASLIEENKKKLETANQESKKEIEDYIIKLEDQKNKVDTQLQSVVVSPEFLGDPFTNVGLYINKRLHKCSNCGFGYFVYEDKYGISYDSSWATVGGIKKTIQCPKCKNVEQYN